VYSRGPTDPLPWVRPLSRRLPDLRIAQSVIGDWTRAASDGARLRAAPSDDAPVLAELPRHTIMAVVAATGDWLRVRLPDGRTGFMFGSVTEAAERAFDRRVLAAAAPIRALPSPIGAVMDSVSAGTVDVLGRFGDYLMVRSPESTGWLSPGD
jgi:SH3-like domain-containing protein